MEPASPHPTVFVDLSPVPDSDSEIDLSEKTLRSSSPSRQALVIIVVRYGELGMQSVQHMTLR